MMLTGFTWLLIAQLAGEACARLLGLPVPGPVIGMALLLAGLMASGRLRQFIGGSADALLAHLSLLFVPAGVGVVLYLKELSEHGLALAVVVVLSTWVGLAVTAWVAQTLLKDKDHQ